MWDDEIVCDANRPIQKVGSPEIRQIPELFHSLVQNKERCSGDFGIEMARIEMQRLESLEFGIESLELEKIFLVKANRFCWGVDYSCSCWQWELVWRDFWLITQSRPKHLGLLLAALHLQHQHQAKYPYSSSVSKTWHWLIFRTYRIEPSITWTETERSWKSRCFWKSTDHWYMNALQNAII